MLNQDALRRRTSKFISELNLPISRFAKCIGFDRTSYYKWMKCDFDLGEIKAEKIDEFLKRFGF